MGWLDFFQGLYNKKETLRSLNGLRGIHYADAIFHNLSVERRVPGISVTIFQKGKQILQKGYGYADIEKKISVDPKNTLFRIASISKCITALAFGKMVEEGILDWDDSFYKHVPYYPKKKYDFTLSQLASHTAGIRGYQGKEYALNIPYSIKQSIEVFKKDPLIFKPGKGYLYNSFDFVLLSLAMQEASGIPFQDYVRKKILIPLGLENTMTPNEVLGLKGYQSSFYTKGVNGFKRATEVNNFYKLAGGGYLSTSEDISKLGKAILNRSLLSPESYQELLSEQSINGKSTYYGLGFQVSQDTNGRFFVGHVGSSIGAYTNFYVYPNEETIISILVNCTDSKVQDALDEAKDALLQDTLS